jgi:hypothetical protein
MRRKVLFGLMLLMTGVLFTGMRGGLWAETNDGGLKDDYRRLEGSWETEARDPGGNVVTIVKTERDRTSVVTSYDHNGNVLHSHSSDFELKRAGDVRIFRFWNLTVTQGPGKGTIQKEPQEYIYKIVGDRLYEIQGALISPERQPPSMNVWKRRDNEL